MTASTPAQGRTQATSEPNSAVPDRLDPALVRLAAVVVLGAIAALLDTTIVNVALGELVREFDVPVSTIQWINSGYLLALTMVVPVTGWAVERFGAKPMWLVSVALFLLGSILCGAAWSLPALIVFRVVQGLGGGMILPLAATILAQAAGPARMGRVMSVVSIPAQVAPVAGPVIGGFIVDSASWRWVFYVNVPVCLLALVLAWRVMPAGIRQPAQRLDVVGLLLLSPALGVLTYGLSRAGTDGLSGVPVVVSAAVAAILLAGFAAHALTTRHPPLIDLRLFTSRGFAAAASLLFLFSFSIFGAMLLIPLYYQQAHGRTALAAGLLLAPQFIGTLVALPIVGRLADRISPRRLVLTGMIIAVVGTIPFTQLDRLTNEVALAGALLVRGIGFGAASVAVMTAAYRNLRPAAIPRATSALQIGQRVGAPIGAAVLAMLLQRQLVRAPGPPEAGALANAYGAAFWWTLLFTAVTLIPAVLLPGPATPRQAGP